MKREIDPGPARREENLRKAREAQHFAGMINDDAAKQIWLRIAQTYLDLAKVVPSRIKVF
jgi:hypothetical protein